MVINKVVTLFHNFEDDGYKFAFSLPASVHFVRGKTPTVSGIDIHNKATIRIFTRKQLEISEGDYIMIGKHDELYKDDALIVSSYTDNRRGSPRMQHWRIDCNE